MRLTRTSRELKAGCFVCHDSMAHWFGPNAQGVAARHHDATGHATWVEVVLNVYYGRESLDPASPSAPEGGKDPT